MKNFFRVVYESFCQIKLFVEKDADCLFHPLFDYNQQLFPISSWVKLLAGTHDIRSINRPSMLVIYVMFQLHLVAETKARYPGSSGLVRNSMLPSLRDLARIRNVYQICSIVPTTRGLMFRNPVDTWPQYSEEKYNQPGLLQPALPDHQ